ncbi:hypothetical protein ACQP2Y_12370 [Actinoplanes sp. CA-051413]|uniref:hypothetical protein n=1 Tax=Actinoplanes sp. CA-051413 TaxID=3239899 RepID=UPI003D976DE1
MFSVASRYQPVPTATYELPGGRTVVYVRRRLLPRPEELTTIGVHIVGPAEHNRLDLVAAVELDDPQQWWQLADANRATDPDDLTTPAGRVLRITLPAGLPSGGGLFGVPHG